MHKYIYPAELSEEVVDKLLHRMERKIAIEKYSKGTGYNLEEYIGRARKAVQNQTNSMLIEIGKEIDKGELN